VRSSERIRAQPNADDTQMERAQKILHDRESCTERGTSFMSKFSFVSFPNDEVVARASRLGVSLGCSPSQVTSSVKKINDIDMLRTLVMLKKNEDKVKKGSGEPSNLVLQKAKDLSFDLEEEEQQGSEGQKDLNPLHGKQKRSYKKKVTEVSLARRCSARLKKKI
jgi:hypothetical protein